MGRIIHQNNGKTTIFTSGEDISSVTPITDTYYVGVDLNTGFFEKRNPDGSLINLEQDLTGGTNTTVVTYSELVTLIGSNGLETGSYYLISNFQTCYDQPDFDYNNNPITSGNYKQGPVEPILVFATSQNKLSEIAYQPAYPKDRILYDWTFSGTEITNGSAFGRITERIDEFNNRTDYDHRNILFKRYKLYTHRPGQPLNGTIEVLGDGTVNGVGTSFTGLTIGDIIYVNSFNCNYEIVSITDDVTMLVTGGTISVGGPGLEYYKTIEESNGIGYFSYKQTNVKTYDYIEYTTFGDAILNDYAKNNYIGNYANNYQNVGSGTFLLANNVFLEGQYESNKFGDYCYNNTFGTDNQNNTWGDYCYQNVSTNDIDDNIIGHYFNNNLINTNLSSNQIGNYFELNKLLSENSTNFENNIIGNNFYNNIIYSNFYGNEILLDFRNNFIGDFGNLSNFEFYRNYIRNNFNGNTIRQNFQNNQIGTNYQNNIINGEFVGNTILNGFNNNITGSYFTLNNIGNGFNNNLVYDNFYQNNVDHSFTSNIISDQFFTNIIGEYFESNRPTNQTLFGWNDLSTVSTRTYDTLYNSLNGQVGNKILGKEFVMFVTSTSQYFKIKFTQWTQGANGGGFQYERQELNSGGSPLSNTITFTKTNYGTEVDVLVPGVVELTRDSAGGLYNIVTDTPPFGGAWPGPGNTEWNSIYTQPNNGERFAYNRIGNNFYNNIIDSDFGYGGVSDYGNQIGDRFENNTIGQYMYNNIIGNYFQNNVVGIEFENNTIKNYFIGNTILDNFESNQIGDYFGNNGTGPGSPIQNFIGNNFKYNNIGNFFGNDFNFPSVGGGTNGDGGNVIANNFQFNKIGDNFIYNVTDNIVDYNNIGHDAWINYFGSNTRHNTIGDLFVGNTGLGGYGSPLGVSFISNKLSNYSAFNAIGDNFQYNSIGDFFGNGGTSNNVGDNFNNNKIGNYFGDDGSHTDGGNVINNNFYDNLIGNKFYNNTIDPLFYRNDIGNQFHNNTIQDIPGGTYFQNNEIGNKFNHNTTDGYFYGNQIGGGFNYNDISDNFYTNVIDYAFNNNIIGIEFNNNIIAYNFGNNIIGQNLNNNTIGYNFNNNTINNDFEFNNIGNSTNGNQIGVSCRKNIISSDFDNNTIGDYLINNQINGDFNGNTTSTGFMWNVIDTDINAQDFSVTFSGNILTFSYASSGTYTDGSYTNVTGTTNSSGSGAEFTIDINGGSITAVTISNVGYGYMSTTNYFTETITLDSSQYGGGDNIVIYVEIVDNPSVYQPYTCDIFERQGGTKRLSYYDSSDILTITNINE